MEKITDHRYIKEIHGHGKQKIKLEIYLSHETFIRQAFVHGIFFENFTKCEFKHALRYYRTPMNHYLAKKDDLFMIKIMRTPSTIKLIE